MHIASVRGEYKIIKLLILFGASPFIFTYVNGFTPLDYARESGKVESLNVLKPLFEEKKNNNKKNIPNNNLNNNGNSININLKNIPNNQNNIENLNKIPMNNNKMNNKVNKIFFKKNIFF